jgi:hypothetical protein
MIEKIGIMVQSAIDGEESAAEVYALLKQIVDRATAGLKVIQDGALAEAREFNKNETYYGGVWEVRNTPTYLDFSKDEVFTNLNQSALKRKKDLNQAWKAKQDGKFYATDEGEEIPVLPVKTPSKETLIFKPKP